jgi:ABC-type uncharacterized transport system ATPase subunit
VPSLTVAENIALGRETQRMGFADRAPMRQRVLDISKRYGLQVDPDARVHDLSVGMQQRVEILKMLYRDARLLILDEPSAVLTPQEVESLFGVLRRLVDGGCTAIFITHKLYEIMTICARATVLRRGRVVGTVETAKSSPAEIARLMVGHDIELPKRTDNAAQDKERLLLRGLTTGERSGMAVALSVKAGEILGIAGVEGNGQQALIETLIGVRATAGGEILLDGTAIGTLSTRQRRERGLALIPEDRNREGLSKPLTIWENLVGTAYYREPASRHGMLNLSIMHQRARELIAQFDIRAAGENVEVGTLSGGNAQKVVIARELAQQPSVLIAAQPTRGLDVGAAQFVHEQLFKLRAAGVGILLISADLDELLAVSDRIAVIYGGRIVQTFTAEAGNREAVGLAMAGKSEAKT